MSTLMYSRVVGRIGFRDAKDAWSESDHPRSDNGQFGSGGGGSAGSEKTKIGKSALREKLEGMTKERLMKSLKNPNVDPKIKKEIERELDDRAERGM